LLAGGAGIYLLTLNSPDDRPELLTLDSPEEDPAAAISESLAFLRDQIGGALTAHLGGSFAGAVESGISQAESVSFSFSGGLKAEPENVTDAGQAYGRCFVHAHSELSRNFGSKLADALFDTVFNSVSWQSKVFIQDTVFKDTAWENHFADEKNLSYRDRTGMLSSVSIFEDLPFDARDLLIRNMTARRYNVGELVVRQGEIGDACYIISSGRVQVEEQDISGDQRILAFLNEGDFFGETALLRDTPRMCDIRATTDAVILAIYKADFIKVAEKHPEAAKLVVRRMKTMQVLLRIPLFADLPTNMLRSVLPKIRNEYYEDGEDVIRRGDVGSNFYLIRAGAVEVLGENDTKVADLGPRDHFGEIALLSDIPRTATVRSRGGVEVLALSKEDFLELTAGSEIFDINLRTVVDERMRAPSVG
jgi:cAMP-dependent protein kinase regulator